VVLIGRPETKEARSEAPPLAAILPTLKFSELLFILGRPYFTEKLNIVFSFKPRNFGKII